MEKKISLKLIFVFAFICFGCSGIENQTSQKYKLPSGKEIKINAIEGLNFENGETALVLNYETEIPIENREELKKEVEEVWAIFQYDVEKANTTLGIISASHFEGSGFYRKGKGYRFLFRKWADGKWRTE